jgi:hypothetical protein
MMEDLVKLMVEQWYLPEEQVRAFLTKSLTATDSLEQLRLVVADMLQDQILSSPNNE